MRLMVVWNNLVLMADLIYLLRSKKLAFPASFFAFMVEVVQALSLPRDTDSLPILSA